MYSRSLPLPLKGWNLFPSPWTWWDLWMHQPIKTKMVEWTLHAFWVWAINGNMTPPDSLSGSSLWRSLLERPGWRRTERPKVRISQQVWAWINEPSDDYTTQTSYWPAEASVSWRRDKKALLNPIRIPDYQK